MRRGPRTTCPKCDLPIQDDREWAGLKPRPRGHPTHVVHVHSGLVLCSNRFGESGEEVFDATARADFYEPLGYSAWIEK